MQLSPEVSALDFAHSVSIDGVTEPGLTTRKVTTEVDLESGQTLIIAGLLDREITNTLSKIPGLGDIPILGRLFQSKSILKNNSELLIIITPEIVRPIPGNQPVPELKWTVPFMTSNSQVPMRQPGLDSTGPVPVHPPSQTMPLEQLLQQQRLIQAAPIQTPLTIAPPAAPAGPAIPPAGGGAAPAAAAGSGGGAGNGQ
jgi:pilus assembly protein CpaC